MQHQYWRSCRSSAIVMKVVCKIDSSAACAYMKQARPFLPGTTQRSPYPIGMLRVKKRRVNRLKLSHYSSHCEMFKVESFRSDRNISECQAKRHLSLTQPLESCRETMPFIHMIYSGGITHLPFRITFPFQRSLLPIFQPFSQTLQTQSHDLPTLGKCPIDRAS